MIEYEYSFGVKDIEPFIMYCRNNQFEKVLELRQIRTLYTNPNQILARLTTDVTEDGEITVLDFKDDDDSNIILKSSRETIPLNITKEGEAATFSILDILGYQHHKTLKRTRTVYQKGQVKFEIDHYIEPDPCYVVAIEGEKQFVDVVYEDLKTFIKQEKKEL